MLPYIIVPVYNGSASLHGFLERINRKWMKQLVFVDDGSADNIFEQLKNINCKSLKHAQNLGKGAAIMTAVDWIVNNGGESAITIDIDLQHPPEFLDTYCQIPNETILLGYRNNRQKMPLLRQFSNFITSLLISIRSCAVIKDSQCGYRSFNTNIFSKIQCYEKGFQFESEFLIKASIVGWKINHISIPTIYNGEPSAMRIVGDTVKFIKMWFMSFLWT